LNREKARVYEQNKFKEMKSILSRVVGLAGNPE